jgi:hypothetical protein
MSGMPWKSKKSHCKRGHPYTAENTHRDSRGTRSCKQCRAEHQRDWAKRNPKSVKNTSLKRKYRISLDEYQEMFEGQSGICAISGLPSDGKMLAVDHNHVTGSVRQLLHNDINVALGLFRENPEWLRRAADYIEKWRNDETGVSSGVVRKT